MNHSGHHVHKASSDHALSSWERIQDAFSQYGFMPHGHCYLWKPLLVSIHVVSDLLIGFAYLSISITLYALVKKINLPFTRVVLCFGVFIGACGLTHFMEIWNLWNADYWWSAWVKVVTAIASVATGIYLFQLRHSIVQVAEAAKLAEQRRLDLELLTSELEVRVAERTAQLNEAVKMRDQFLSIASHELKTPLTSLKLINQIEERKIEKLRDPQGPQSSTIKYFKTVNLQTDRLTRLVDEMLDVSRIQAGKLDLHLEEKEICSIVSEVLERFRPQFDEIGMVLSIDTCEEARVKLDSFRIEQVLNNLLTNTMKYSPGRPVFIHSEKIPKEGIVKVTIKDLGVGIAKENLERIFQRFERLPSTEQVSGLGLGLFISREIIEAHGGKIWAESEMGQGTSFIFTLPLI